LAPASLPVKANTGVGLAQRHKLKASIFGTISGELIKQAKKVISHFCIKVNPEIELLLTTFTDLVLSFYLRPGYQ
jgi:hypothetical protein